MHVQLTLPEVEKLIRDFLDSSASPNAGRRGEKRIALIQPSASSDGASFRNRWAGGGGAGGGGWAGCWFALPIKS